MSVMCYCTLGAWYVAQTFRMKQIPFVLYFWRCRLLFLTSLFLCQGLSNVLILWNGSGLTCEKDAL